MSATPPGDRTAEQRRRQAHAEELLLAVAARLLGEARRGGAFPTEPGALAAFAARIAPELELGEYVLVPGEEHAELPRADYRVTLGEPTPEAIQLGCDYGAHSTFGRLRIDGVLDEGGSSAGYGPTVPESRIVELSPTERETVAKARALIEADGRPPEFAGREYLRTLAVQPQREAAVQVLAVELYGDGLVVRFTYDDPVDVRPSVPLHYYELAEVESPLEALLAEAEAEGGNLEPNLSVRDDLGTRYLWAGGGRGGVEVVQGEACFVPAVPAAATRLLVASYAGTVEVDL